MNFDEKRVISPLCRDSKLTKLWAMDISRLESEYQSTFNADIRYLTNNHSQIALYECSESGLRFFYPTSIVGDSQFYEILQNNNWYYMPTKWEFEEALKYIPAEGQFSLLEVGSARGDFLKMIVEHNKNTNATGLELNRNAVAEARKCNLNVIEESTSIHRKQHASDYDFVVSFQVLEHISNPKQVLEEMFNMLKVGGRLIIGVPDNSRRAFSSIFFNDSSLLNMPPHHQTQWDNRSLLYLTKIFPLRLDDLIVEPATARHHSNSYRSIVKKDLLGRYGSWLGLLLYLIGRPFYIHALSNINKYLPAHTILAVYTKTDA